MDIKLLLVINCGSSSLKFGLFNSSNLTLLAEGLADSLNSPQGILKLSIADGTFKLDLVDTSHEQAIRQILDKLEAHFLLSRNLQGIGHRVVHGGEAFKTSTLIDDDVIAQIEECITLAPLHNPANLTGIKILSTQFPDTPQVAVFDTSFHQTMPPHAFVYGLPYRLYADKGLRRYGFHGTSHRYVSEISAEHLHTEIGKLSIITAHLGNGASVAAIKNGQSVDTSMGLTPLEGLLMGTRCGDIDPGIFDFLLSQHYTVDMISSMLNKESGLLGVSGISNDMRTLIQESNNGNQRAALAIDIFCFRLAKYIAAMSVSLTKLDALVFTGGIGENASLVRSKTVSQLRLLGLLINEQQNEDTQKDQVSEIHADNSVPILVIPTNEEKLIAQDTLALIGTDHQASSNIPQQGQ